MKSGTMHTHTNNGGRGKKSTVIIIGLFATAAVSLSGCDHLKLKVKEYSPNGTLIREAIAPYGYDFTTSGTLSPNPEFAQIGFDAMGKMGSEVVIRGMQIYAPPKGTD
jgi:hypothetical protein